MMGAMLMADKPENGENRAGEATFLGLPRYKGVCPDPPPSRPHGWLSEMAHAFAATLCLSFAGIFLCQVAVLCSLDLQSMDFQDVAVQLLTTSRYGLLGGSALGLWIDWHRAVSDQVRGKD
jgi:hypothetical protein